MISSYAQSPMMKNEKRGQLEKRKESKNEAGSTYHQLSTFDAKPSLTQRFFGLLTWVRLDQDELGLHNPVGNHALLHHARWRSICRRTPQCQIMSASQSSIPPAKVSRSRHITQLTRSIQVTHSSPTFGRCLCFIPKAINPTLCRGQKRHFHHFQFKLCRPQTRPSGGGCMT